MNRALWSAVALAALLATLTRYRFAMRQSVFGLRREPSTTPAPTLSGVRAVPRFGAGGTWAQLRSQLRMDLRAILRSPPFYVVLALAANASYQHFYGPELLVLGTQRAIPLTGLLVDQFNLGLLELVLLTVVYYGGELVHRERSSHVAEIADASPIASGVSVLAKTAALSVALMLMLSVGILAFVALQAVSGHTNFELGLYLKSAFLVYGLQHYILAAVAIALLLVIGNRWLGMLAVVVFFIARFALQALGFDDLLRFRPP